MDIYLCVTPLAHNVYDSLRCVKIRLESVSVSIAVSVIEWLWKVFCYHYRRPSVVGK